MIELTYDKTDSSAEYYELLINLMERWEYEIVEFKEAKGQYSEDKIGQYFMPSFHCKLKALSNVFSFHFVCCFLVYHFCYLPHKNHYKENDTKINIIYFMNLSIIQLLIS